MTSTTCFEDPLKFGILFALGLGDDEISAFLALTVLLVCSQSADFFRRLYLLMANVFPLRLAWLTYAAHDVPCDHRRKLVKRLLAARNFDDLDRDSTTVKLRLTYCVMFLQQVGGWRMGGCFRALNPLPGWGKSVQPSDLGKPPILMSSAAVCTGITTTQQVYIQPGAYRSSGVRHVRCRSVATGL